MRATARLSMFASGWVSALMVSACVVNTDVTHAERRAPSAAPSVRDRAAAPAVLTDIAPAARANAAAAAQPIRPGYRRRLERHGVTWTLDRPTRAGRYVNGDWWVVGPVALTAITPACATSSGRTRHGAMTNPDPADARQGYDSAATGAAAQSRFDHRVNVARGVTAATPLALPPSTSLVSSVSHPVAGQLPQLERCAVLTVVAAPPPVGSFRPPYCGVDKQHRWSAADLDVATLPRLQPVAGAPRPSDLVERLERTWLDHVPGLCGRYLHPREHMPDYGRDIAELVGDAALTLTLDIPAQEKRALLVVMLQLGIDIFGVVHNGGRFVADGGSGSGRKLPMLLAGTIFRDDRMLGYARTHGDLFGEDAQTFYVRETSPGVFNSGHGGYTAADVGLPEWGNHHADDPSGDRREWGSDPYRRCCTANAWVGMVLAARIMGLRDRWSHPALFDYLDRYMQIEQPGGWMRSRSPFAERMWERYRPQQ